jgi:hypothetical protein
MYWGRGALHPTGRRACGYRCERRGQWGAPALYSAGSWAIGSCVTAGRRAAARRGSSVVSPAAASTIAAFIAMATSIAETELAPMAPEAPSHAQLRKEDVDRRFPGLLDSVLNADDPALV